MASTKPLEIDGIAGTEIRDVQGEILDVAGADISDLESGAGRLNDNHAKGFFNSLGRVTYAKKIFKAEDCETDREKYFWEKVKSPYIYFKGKLYDDEDHPNAKAAAAILRNLYKDDSPLHIKASVEGGVVSRGIKDRSLLAKTKIHSIALTFTPANRSTLVEPTNLQKSDLSSETDYQLIKSVIHLAETNVPSFRHVVRDASASKIIDNVSTIIEMLNCEGLNTSLAIPDKQKLIKSALRAKIKNNIEKMNSLVKTAKKDGLEKGFKQNLAAGLVTAAASTTPVTQAMPSANTEQQSVVAPSEKRADHTSLIDNIKQKKPALWAIAQIESSGGQNLDHKELRHGMHKGMRAGGPWGMMPHTVATVFNLSSALKEKYPELHELSQSVDANHDKITEHLNKNPELAMDLARTYINHINKRHGGDMDKVFFSWKNGPNSVEGRDVAAHPYVQAAKRTLASVDEPKQSDSKKVSLNKALTAGYGAASAPTSRVGGSVIITETPEGKSDFKRITCEDCGENQVLAKGQLKCRKCNKAWSFDKLVKFVFKYK